MSISFNCITCSKPFSVKIELAGKKIKCGNCGSLLEVPTDGEGAGSDADADADAMAPTANPTPPPAAPADDVKIDSHDGKAPSIHCPICGTTASPGTKLCIGCGTDLETGEQPSMDETVPQSPVDQLKLVINNLPRQYVVIGGGALALIVVMWLGWTIISSQFDDWALEEGRTLAAAGKLKAARSSFNEAIKHNPKNLDAIEELALVTVKLGNDKQVTSVATRLINVAKEAADKPRQAWGWVLKARSSLTADQSRQARQSIDKAKALDGSLAGVHDVLGHLAYQSIEGRSGDEQKAAVDEAIGHYERALEANSLDANSYINLGKLVLVWRQDPSRAEGHFNRAAQLSPEAAEPFILQADAAIKAKDYQSALKPLRLAVKAAPDNARARYLLAVVLVEKDLPSEAIEHAEKAAEVEPDVYEHRILLGRLYSEESRLDLALDEFVAAGELDRQRAEPKLREAKIRQERGEREQAIKALLKAQQLDDGDSAETHVLIAQIYSDGETEQDYKKAKESFLKALEKNPDDLEAKFQLGCLLLDRLNKAESALTYFTEVLSAETQRSEVWLKVAEAHKKRKDIKAVVAAYHAALEIEPTNEGVLTRLYKFAMQVRCWQEATTTIKRLQEVNENLPDIVTEHLNKAKLQLFREGAGPCGEGSE